MTEFPLIYRAILDYKDVDGVQVSDGLIIYLSKDFTDEKYEEDRELYFLPIYLCNPKCTIKPSNLVYLKIENQKIKNQDYNYNLSVGNKIENKVQLLNFFKMVSANMSHLKKWDKDKELVLKQITTPEDIQKFLLLCKINNNLIEGNDISEFLIDFINMFQKEIKTNKSRLNNNNSPNFYNKLVKNIMSEYNLSYGLNTEDDLPKAQHQKNDNDGNPASKSLLEGFGTNNEYNLIRLLETLKLTDKLVFSINNKETKYYIKDDGRRVR